MLLDTQSQVREATIKALARAVLVVGLLGGSCLAAGQEAIKPGETLDLDRCLRIALENLPSLRAARATSEADRSLVREAASAYCPQLDWATSASRAATPSTTFNTYSTRLDLRQTIFDFGRTPAQVRIQKRSYQASVSEVETATQQAVFDVKQSYYAALQAKRNRDAADEAVRQYQVHLDQARGLYEVGLQPRYDVTKATVDLGSAKVNLIKADNAVKLALATLNNAMGVAGTLDYGLEDTMSFDPYPITLEEALAQAYSNRPELAAFMARRQAAESSISLAKAAEALRAVGLAGREAHHPNQLSGGERQRVAIARALVKGAPIIPADEPTGNLDTRTSVEIMELFVRLNEEARITLVLVTHEPDIAAFTRRVIRFRDGRVVSDERTAESRPERAAAAWAKEAAR